MNTNSRRSKVRGCQVRDWLSTAVVACLLAACGGGGGGDSDDGGSPPPPAPPAPPAPPPPPPTTTRAVDDAFNIDMNARNNLFDVVANDTIGGNLTGTVACYIGGDRAGNVRMGTDARTLLYTPATDFHGIETLGYLLDDGSGELSEGRVTVDVRRGAIAAASAKTSQDGVASVAARESVAAGALPSSHDIPNDRHTQSELAVNGVVQVQQEFWANPNDLSGEVEPGDWHRVHLEEDVLYRFRVRFNGDQRTYWPRLLIFNLWGVGGQFDLLNPNWLGASEIELEYMATYTGAHYIGVEYDTLNDDTPATCLGNCVYEVRAEVLDDYTGTINTNGRTGGNFPVRGKLEAAGDQDWFRANLFATQTSTFTLQALPGAGTLVNRRMQLFNTSGVVIGSIQTSGTDEIRLTRTSPTDETVFVAVTSPTSSTGTYTLLGIAGGIRAGFDTEMRVTPDATPVIGQFSGRVGAWYRTFLEAGKRYDLQMRGENHGSGAEPAPQVGLLDTAGIQVAYQSQSSASTATVQVTAPYTGIYYVLVPASQLGYRLTLQQVDAPAPGTDVIRNDRDTTAFALSRIAPLAGAIENAGDADWYSVGQLMRGEFYTWHVEGLRNPRLRLVNPTGAVVSEGTVDATGRATVVIENHQGDIFEPHYLVASSTDGSTGSYRIVVARGEVPDNDQTWARLVADGSLKSALWAHADTDWIRVDLLNDHVYRFDAQGADTGQGLLPNPLLMIMRADGTVVAEADDGGEGRNARIEYRANATATHFVVVASGNRVPPFGSYKVSINDLTAPGGCGLVR